VDVVIDFVGGETLARSFETLQKGGLLLSAFMPPDPELAKRYGVSARFVDGLPTVQQLDFGTALIEQGKVVPRIVKVLRLEQAATAQQLVAAGGLNGKVVLTVE
jgi:NADPH:quinone reductase-like Zn-dependent oxidoreductase